MKNKCLYCDNITTPDTRHFVSACCDRGMCDECYNSDKGTDNQFQVDYMDEEDYNKYIKGTKYEREHADFVCFDCVEPKHPNCTLCEAGGQPFNNNTSI